MKKRQLTFTNSNEKGFGLIESLISTFLLSLVLVYVVITVKDNFLEFKKSVGELKVNLMIAKINNLIANELYCSKSNLINPNISIDVDKDITLSRLNSIYTVFKGHKHEILSLGEVNGITTESITLVTDAPPESIPLRIPVSLVIEITTSDKQKFSSKIPFMVRSNDSGRMEACYRYISNEEICTVSGGKYDPNSVPICK